VSAGDIKRAQTGELPARPGFEEALSAIPLFPLPHVVLFPRAVLPLHVFEPRYRRMIADCLATHGALAVVPIGEGEDEHGRPTIARVSGGGLVVEHEPLADGRSNIVVLGQARLALDELEPEEGVPYRRARARVLEDLDVPVAESERTAMIAAATMFAAEVRRHDPTFRFRLPAEGQAGALADLCAYQLVVDGHARQAILEELDPAERVRVVIHQLASQQGAMMRDVRGGTLN
jgi:Lon protease-like protein